MHADIFSSIMNVNAAVIQYLEFRHSANLIHYLENAQSSVLNCDIFIYATPCQGFIDLL